MKLAPAETSLVIAGSWNPAIVQPGWIWKYGLEKDDALENRIQVFVPTGAGLIFEFPRFSFDGLLVAARPDALVLTPKESTQVKMEEIENVTHRMLSQLTHTPITGVGHNFEFRDSEPKPEFLKPFTDAQLDLVDASPDGWGAAASGLTSTFRFGDASVNITRLFDGNSLTLRFNFHHPVTTAEKAMEVLSGQNHKRIFDNLQVAKELATKMYGELDEN